MDTHHTTSTILATVKKIISTPAKPSTFPYLQSEFSHKITVLDGVWRGLVCGMNQCRAEGCCPRMRWAALCITDIQSYAMSEEGRGEKKEDSFLLQVVKTLP